MIKQRQLKMTQNTHQTILTERDQADMMMKKQLLLLQLEMIENELKQAELIERLKTTQGTIEQLQTNQTTQEPNTRYNVTQQEPNTRYNVTQQEPNPRHNVTQQEPNTRHNVTQQEPNTRHNVTKQKPNTRHNVPAKCQHNTATDKEEPYSSYFSYCYHGAISWQESVDLLKHCSEGTFLVRDSQNPGFMYSP